MDPAVSVIIPVYNGEKYLAECLGNIVNQTLKEIEIILVNDASKDGSLSIMKDCQRQFPEKVKVIDSEENLGAGGARNLGIAQAIGRYIGFVDCDDIVDIHMYEKLYARAAEKDCDIVDCGYYKQAEDLAIVHTSDELTGKLDINKRRELIVGGGYIVTKLFRRTLFEDTNLRFRRNAILEDSDFLTYVFATAKTIENVKEVFYYYRNNEESSSNTNQLQRYCSNIYEAMKNIYEKLHGLPSYPQLKDAVEYEILQMYSYGVNMCLGACLNGDLQAKEMMKKLAHEKKRTVTGNYENPYVQAKQMPLDILVMQKNDEGADGLLEWVAQNYGGQTNG